MICGIILRHHGKFGNDMNFENSYKGKKVLITGDTGFKGSWLAIWLVNLGAEVYGYALAPLSELDNYCTTGLEKYIEHINGDIRDEKKLLDYFRKVNPDIAFHLAAQPLVLLSYKNPVETFSTNLMGVVNFFEAVRNTPSVKVAINVTSDKCYDNNEWIWGYRENDAMGGKDPYSASKGCAELITHSYQHSFFNTGDTCLIASARAGNVIGGGDWAIDRIIPDYYRAYKKNEKLIVRNPYSTRPWQHVLEPLSGYLNLGSKLLSVGREFCGAWNFGPEDTTNYSVKDLIDKILSIDLHGGYLTPPDDISKSHEANLLKLDISKAVNLLHWRPVLTFDETVEFTVKGYQDDIENNDLMNKRISQINLYTDKASKKGIKWTL
jgi:CDP-glucose 4,6-dehydratase